MDSLGKGQGVCVPQRRYEVLELRGEGPGVIEYRVLSLSFTFVCVSLYGTVPWDYYITTNETPVLY